MAWSRGVGGLHRLKTWKLQNGRGKEVNDVLKDFDELERTGLGPGNAIVARRYPVKYGEVEREEEKKKKKAEYEEEEGGERGRGTRGQKTEETLRWKRWWRRRQRCKGQGARSILRRTTSTWAPAGSDADRKPEIEEKRRSETKAIRRESG